MARTYEKRTDYRKIKKVVEEMVSAKHVMLAEDVITELDALGHTISIHRLAHIVRYSKQVIKLYERKKCEGAPTGHFVWLVSNPAWESFKRGE